MPSGELFVILVGDCWEICKISPLVGVGRVLDRGVEEFVFEGLETAGHVENDIGGAKADFRIGVGQGLGEDISRFVEQELVAVYGRGLALIAGVGEVAAIEVVECFPSPEGFGVNG